MGFLIQILLEDDSGYFFIMAFDCFKATGSIRLSSQGAGLLLSPGLAGDLIKVDVFQHLQGNRGGISIENLCRDFLKHSNYSYKFCSVNMCSSSAHADSLCLNKNF